MRVMFMLWMVSVVAPCSGLFSMRTVTSDACDHLDHSSCTAVQMPPDRAWTAHLVAGGLSGLGTSGKQDRDTRHFMIVHECIRGAFRKLTVESSLTSAILSIMKLGQVA